MRDASEERGIRFDRTRAARNSFSRKGEPRRCVPSFFRVSDTYRGSSEFSRPAESTRRNSRSGAAAAGEGTIEEERIRRRVRSRTGGWVARGRGRGPTRGGLGSGGLAAKAGEVRIRVSTLVVHPMQDTARHDLRSPRHIPDAPCKVSRGVSTGTVRYVIGPWMLDSLHGGALPVVVLFDRHGPHMQPVAYQCANLECVPPPSGDALSSPSLRFLRPARSARTDLFFRRSPPRVRRKGIEGRVIRAPSSVSTSDSSGSPRDRGLR